MIKIFFLNVVVTSILAYVKILYPKSASFLLAGMGGWVIAVHIFGSNLNIMIIYLFQISLTLSGFPLGPASLDITSTI